ncbi:MAG: arabinan endo-1,5-alpha-L-arabinosidase [Desulfobacteraceae bacterium]|jgi:arabinan endo-1,5-alpha-L-arabinosidase
MKNFIKKNLTETFFMFLVAIFFVSEVTVFAAPSHDPTKMIQDEQGRYWIFTTGTPLWCMYSTDPSFNTFTTGTSPTTSQPAWVASQVPDFEGSYWAPSITHMNGYYYLYYSCSTFGSSRSGIGVTRTASLATPNWQDQGMVVSSNGGRDEINAIDPAILKDDDGRVWMTYGSWFGGIAVVEIDPNTGLAISSTYHTGIGGGHADNEAPFLLKNGCYYFLFYNKGNCCQGTSSTYTIWVARSNTPNGTYTDSRQILGNENNRIGPGHFGYNEDLDKVTYHYYDSNDGGAAKLHVTTLGWENGWPVIHGSGDDGTNHCENEDSDSNNDDENDNNGSDDNNESNDDGTDSDDNDGDDNNEESDNDGNQSDNNGGAGCDNGETWSTGDGNGSAGCGISGIRTLTR